MVSKVYEVNNPQFKIPSKYIINQTISALHETASKRLIDDISNCKLRPSCTVDLWTGKNHRGYMGVTIHFFGTK